MVGWQLMALKSGQMAYLPVNPAVFEKAKEFLKSVSYGGQYGGRFSYMPGGSRSAATTGRPPPSPCSASSTCTCRGPIR